ncbi:ATP-binding cassette domain-containing protein [Aeromicrobium sp.]|uniref:ABC transporter ATP-binding protein n=1 Tax=Aeromicrobium sp. TaxID=1871063 RepID=UPI0025BAC7BD|nr:ATP-binding cassette domain-containing protein [Aeromicrobium sp.]MCK5892267.1 ATP-binding cassette domain-containing protein [Aeromicrobium sp.]
MVRGELRLEGFTWRPLGRRVPVVADLDLHVEAGSRVLLAGPSGAGKSTLLHALVGALGTTIAGELSGSVRVDGRVGFVPQQPGDAVVAERVGRDVAFGPENVGLDRDETWRRVDAGLAAVGLHQGRDHPTAALSGGELQRLALAGVLALEPDVVLLDEPTSMLDPAHASAVREAVGRTVGGGRATLVVVEHHLEPWLDLVDRVVVLGDDGSVVADTTPDEFLRDHRDRLGELGVWMPGLPAPRPITVDPALVRPERPLPTLTASDLTVRLRSRSLRGSTTTTALCGVDAAVAPGALTALTGPSGAGKSTLLAAFGGLLDPDGGSVTGLDPTLASRRSRDLARDVGWSPQVPEHGFLAPTVAGEVALTAQRSGRAVDAQAWLELVGLGHLAGAHPYRLSGGEQRRLSILAAAAHRPGLLLLDEPTVGQDRVTWAAVAGIAVAAAAAGVVVATATHDDLLVDLADEVVDLRAGVRT